MGDKNFGYRRLRILFWCAAIAFGAVDAWATRYNMNLDGISYLDMGDAYLRGDWNMAINAYWSPLYASLLGLFLKVLKPSPQWEFPVVHLANFVIYLAALASFEFFLRALIDYRRKRGNDACDSWDVSLPERAWWILGYSLFIWTSLILIGTKLVTPDMCVAAFVYLTSGLLLRVRGGIATCRTFVLFGAVLGFGYLTKAVMFPLAFVFLAVATFSFRGTWKAEPRILISTLFFLLIASPLIVSLSHAKGRLTFGDSARVNYEIYVDGVDWSIPSSNGQTHPVKRIVESPPTYEFGEPIAGTYPLWYDTSYWHEGIKPYFDLKGQSQAIKDAFLLYCFTLFSPFLQLNVSAGFLMLFTLGAQRSLRLKTGAAVWPLLIVGLSALGLYSLVHVEYRFIGAFVCLLWLGAFSLVRLPAAQDSNRLIVGVIIAIAATTCLSAVWWMSHRDPQDGPAYWKAARVLNEKGIRPGDKVAVVGSYGPVLEGIAYLARLARIQIIAQVNEPERFRTADSSTQSRVIEAIARTGAKAILTLPEPPRSSPESQWQRLGNTNYYAHLLNTASGIEDSPSKIVPAE
jgi:hypothetical protein